MNLALGRVQAAERAAQSMSSPAEREAMLAYAALARGNTSGARAALVRAASDQTPRPGTRQFRTSVRGLLVFCYEPDWSKNADGWVINAAQRGVVTLDRRRARGGRRRR